MNNVLTVPNIVSFVRILLVPVFVWLLLGPDEVAAAGWLLGFIGATDWVDGYLARRLDQVSELGKALDPIADRLAVAAALVAGLIAGVLPAWFAIALLARETAVALGALYLATRSKIRIDVRRVGKLATLLVYAAVAWFYVGEGADFDPLIWAAWLAGIPGLVLYYVAAGLYVGDARRAMVAAG